MENDIDALTRLNIEIGKRETDGDAEAHAWFEKRLASKLTFRRADLKTFDDRSDFIRKVAPADPRDTTVESVVVDGDGAFVKCTVKRAFGRGREALPQPAALHSRAG